MFAVVNGVSWQMDPSPWPGAMTAYFVTLVIMSSLVAASTGSNGKLPWRIVAAVCGASLVALGITIGVIMYRCIVEGRNDVLPEFAMIAVAAFTFYNAVVAIIGATRTRKRNLPARRRKRRRSLRSPKARSRPTPRLKPNRLSVLNGGNYVMFAQQIFKLR